MGLVSFLLLALAIAALLVPPLLAYAALVRGHRLVAIGVAGAYSIGLALVLRIFLRARPPE